MLIIAGSAVQFLHSQRATFSISNLGPPSPTTKFTGGRENGLALR